MIRYLADSTKPSGEAVNEDGTLKDAQEIQWLDDPDDEAELFPASVTRNVPSTSAMPLPTAFTFATPITSDPELTRKRRGTESANQSAPPSKKNTNAKLLKPKASAGVVGPTPKQPQPIDHVQQLTTVVTAAAASGPSHVEIAPDGPQKRKKNATGDVYTVFTKDEETDEHICSVCLCVGSNLLSLLFVSIILIRRCRRRKTEKPQKYAGLRCTFKGNVTTLWTHIAREGMDHFTIYRDACIRGGISINERAIPQEEKDRKLGLNQPDGSQCVYSNR
jgi:hypothetical protein